MTAAAAEQVVQYIARERTRMPKAALELLVLGAYQRGLVSGGRAAELLGLSLEKFLARASREGIAVLDQSAEELEEDLRNA